LFFISNIYILDGTNINVINMLPNSIENAVVIQDKNKYDLFLILKKEKEKMVFPRIIPLLLL